jgi:hypothetical protein
MEFNVCMMWVMVVRTVTVCHQHCGQQSSGWSCYKVLCNDASSSGWGLGRIGRPGSMAIPARQPASSRKRSNERAM